MMPATQANAEGYWEHMELYDLQVRLLARLLHDFPAEHEPCPVGSDCALDNAILTAPAARDPALLKKLEAIMQRINRS